MKNILFVLTLCLLISCEQSNTLVVNRIDDDILQHSNDYQGDWITYGKNYGENRHSELNLINKETVKDLMQKIYGNTNNHDFNKMMSGMIAVIEENKLVDKVKHQVVIAPKKKTLSLKEIQLEALKKEVSQLRKEVN